MITSCFKKCVGKNSETIKNNHTKLVLSSPEKGIVLVKYSAACKGTEFDSGAAVLAGEYLMTRKTCIPFCS